MSKLNVNDNLNFNINKCNKLNSLKQCLTSTTRDTACITQLKQQKSKRRGRRQCVRPGVKPVLVGI